MEGDMNQSAGPVFCRGGCGFYGSSATDGLCSKCFKDSLKKKNDPGQGHLSPSGAAKIEEAFRSANLPFPSTSSEMISASAQSAKDEMGFAAAVADVMISSSGALADAALSSKAELSLAAVSDAPATTSDASGGSSEDKPPAPKKSNRCDSCRKKVGLTGFECRCGGLFCGTHRYSDMHECQFDYKALGQEEIRKNNPVVMAEKIEKL